MPDPDRSAAPRPETPWLRRVGTSAWYVVGLVAVVVAAAWLVVRLTVVIVPVAVAFLLAGLLQPLVDRLRSRLDGSRLGRDWVAPLVVVLAVTVIAFGVLAGLTARLVQELPDVRDQFTASLEDAEERFSIELPALPDVLSSDGASGDTSTAERVVRIGTEVVFGMFLTVALTFLFLKDGSALWTWVLRHVPHDRREEVNDAGRAAWSTLGGYVRGLTVVALFDAVGIAVGLLVLGVPLVLALAVLQFVASYVPTIGAFVAGGVAVVVAFGSGGLTTALLVLVVVVVVQQMGNDVIEPWVMHRAVALHPIVVLVAVSAGAALWGIPGALLFVPATAALAAAGHVVWERHWSSGAGGFGDAPTG